MKTNDSPNACPKCGAAVPPEAPQGLCPKCVLAQAVAPEAAPTATTNIPSLERLAVAFPQLQIVELIGRGGMGFVFKARQPHLDRFVALKLLPDSLAHDAHFAERFNREGRTLARLNHPNIVSVFDFGQAGGFYYLLMEYVDGVNLRQAMQAGRFSPAEALSIVPKICEALQYAHEEGVLHRDIKPENILLDAKGRVKIADFGIAKIVGDEKSDISLTATGAALGTPHYMAPEQWEKPGSVDHRADIYSLGVVFYEMLTGELPIGRFAAPSTKTPVGTVVDEVVFRTLERDRERRFQSAGEVKTRVETIAASPAPEAAKGEADSSLWSRGMDYRSKTTLFGLPWLHVTSGVDPQTGKVRVAKGIIAIGPIAKGFFAMGGRAYGAFAFGGVAIGGLTFGGLGLGLFSFAGLAVGLIAALGGLVGAPIAVGGMAVGYQAFGGSAYGVHAYGPNVRDAAAQAFFEPWARSLLVEHWLAFLFCTLSLSGICALVSGVLPLWLERRQRASSAKSPGGTIVVQPEHLLAETRRWSWKAVWAAVLTGLSLPVPMLFAVLLYLSRGNLGGWVMLGGFVAILPGVVGTILGWMGVSDIREHRGQLRGLPLAVFAALTLPLLFLVGATMVAPWLALARSPSESAFPLSVVLTLCVPVGALTFAIWSVYRVARWGANKPASHQRGVLKWVFFVLLAFGLGLALIPGMRKKSTGNRTAHSAETNSTPWIRFTFTAVELREIAGVRWLAIDYLDDVHGDCQKAFPWETTIPGFKAQTRSTEFVTDAKDASPAVRHQRIEYRMPDTSPRDQLERLRDNLEKALQRKSFRLELGEQQAPLLLFELPGVEGGSLKAWIKVMPPLEPNVSPEYRQAVDRLNQLRVKEQELLVRYTEGHPLVKKLRDQIAEAQERMKRLGQAPQNKPGSNSHALQFRLLADEADTNTPVDLMTEFRSDGARNSLRILRTVLLDGSAVARAELLETNSCCTIDINLTEEGARQFAAITGANLNRRLAIVSQDRVLSAPVIRTPISGGKLQISGNMPLGEARQLVASLNRTDMESSSASDARMFIDVAKIEPLPPAIAEQAGPRTNSLDWRFICLIPPNHVAQILFVRWTNGIPTIAESRLSAYHKVGKTPAEIELFISHDLNGPPIPEDRRSQWTVSPGMEYSSSTYAPADPPYRRMETPSRMSVYPGHQRKIPLVEFAAAGHSAGDRSDGVELRIILQPLTTPAIRTVPTEKDNGHYISGHGLIGTMEEALDAIRDLPIDP